MSLPPSIEAPPAVANEDPQIPMDSFFKNPMVVGLLALLALVGGSYLISLL